MFLLDENIREKLRNRDHQYLERLFLDINPYLQRVLAGRGLFGNSSDEIICETWLTFLNKLDSFEGRSEIRTYLTGIMLFKVREHFRSLKKYTQPEENLEDIIDNAFTDNGSWKQGPEDPSILFHQKEIGHFIEKCLEGLSHQQRDAFVLREVEEEKSETICNILGVSVTNLGVLLFRAKEKLRKCLDGSLHKEMA